MKKCMLAMAFLTATTLLAAAPSAVEWQNANEAALAAATDESALAAVVADEASALALLNRVRGAYATDPLVAFRVSAVSQWVMGEEPCALAFWKPNPAEGRRVWVKALVSTAEWNSDNYIKTFCLDQLRWCGCNCPCLLSRIAKIGEASGDKGVKDFAAVVIRELKMR